MASDAPSLKLLCAINLAGNVSRAIAQDAGASKQDAGPQDFVFSNARQAYYLNQGEYIFQAQWNDLQARRPCRRNQPNRAIFAHRVVNELSAQNDERVNVRSLAS